MREAVAERVLLEGFGEGDWGFAGAGAAEGPVAVLALVFRTLFHAEGAARDPEGDGVHADVGRVDFHAHDGGVIDRKMVGRKD